MRRGILGLVFAGALSIFAVGCATEEGGDKVFRPAIGESKDKDDSSGPSSTQGTTGDNGGVASPVTPADGPVATPGADTKPVLQAKPIACATNEDSVTQSYRVALQRDPDPGGLQHWAAMIQNGDTRLGVLNKIISSEEFASIHAELTNEEFLSYLYNAFFNRSPDAGGLQVHLAALDGGQSRASIAQAFANSEEFKSPASNKATACYF